MPEFYVAFNETVTSQCATWCHETFIPTVQASLDREIIFILALVFVLLCLPSTFEMIHDRVEKDKKHIWIMAYRLSYFLATCLLGILIIYLTWFT